MLKVAFAATDSLSMRNCAWSLRRHSHGVESSRFAFPYLSHSMWASFAGITWLTMRRLVAANILETTNLLLAGQAKPNLLFSPEEL